MILKQYYLSCLSHASYLVGDEEAGAALVVDPQRDTAQYLSDAAELGLEIRYVVLSHFHADFIAGHVELRDQAGATICLGARARAEYAFRPLRTGESLELGRTRIEVLETPGHSPESICLVIHDRVGDSDKPAAVLTGDTLFIGDVGRPDLRVSLGWSAEELGGLLYDSIHSKLLQLPDDTLVYPAHGAGSMCGKNLGAELVSTIGTQRRFNYALQPMDREDFVRLVTADQPEAPAYFTYDAVLNTKERPNLDAMLRNVLRPLDLDEALRLAREDAQLLDVRNPQDYAGAHVEGSINIGLGGQYATWAGTLLDQNRPIVIIADPGHELEGVTRLARIGFDKVAGYVRGGMHAFASRPELVRATGRITAASLAEQLGSAAAPVVIDVRSPREWTARRMAGARNAPLSRPIDLVKEAEAARRPVVVLCQSGYRSSIAASLLQRHGIPRVADLVGGLTAWEASGLPVVA